MGRRMSHFLKRATSRNAWFRMDVLKDVRHLAGYIRALELRPVTGSLGSSFGDRACLSLALDVRVKLSTIDATLAGQRLAAR